MLRSVALRAAGHAPGTAFRRRAIATLAAGAVIGAGMAVPAAAVDLPGQTPGVTLRTFAFGQAPSEICTLKEGTTPNVDKHMPTISWTEAGEFGMEDNFLTHVLATLTVPVDGEYTFRLTSDDGSKLHIDDELVIDHDGLHAAEPKDGSVTLTAGSHDLFIEHIEAGGGQELHLEWQAPGASGFELVPSSALSTEADVVRVTAPGTKYCEGATDTAGDGLRLDAVNPNYELTDLRPEGFEPKVSGLAFTPDERLAVVTTGEVSSGGWRPDPVSGEVFFLDGVVDADGPEDVTVTKVADELLNPMGIEVIGDSIFVSERSQLTQLTDPDGDGFYDVHTKIAEWPFGGAFHEFAFGLVHDEDYFYVNLSVGIDNGGATTDPQLAENRGTAIKIDRETGEVSYIAGGLRTPNGIGFGPGGDLFATDNQGAWLPANKLVHIEQDKFFNHFTNPDGPFDDQPVAPPAVWIPQNEIGNSPSQPVMLEQGPFAGQMLIGDVTYGGLQRAFLEEVDGEYQGAIFRHSAGFESGINRTIVGPDGAIYVGGTGEGGNWGESGKLRYGLQRLTPVNADTFDMKEVRIVEGGFEIEYTHPVSEETAANIAEAYQVQQWRYQPTQQYGGPKIDEHPLDVTAAEISEDRTTVTLAIDGLKPGYVAHLRSPRPFESATGQELWNTEAWYTMNSIPGYVAPPDDQYYEGEDAIPLGASSVAADHSNYSGTGFAANIQAVGSGRQFEVNVDEAGTYAVNLRYANGIHPYPELRSKNVSLYVNGEDLGQWTLPTTGDWKTWEWATKNLELEAGVNTIALQYDEGDEGNVNLDVLSIGENPDICTPVEPEDGYTALFDGTLASLNDGWRMAGPGGFGRQDDCSLRGEGGMGLLWYTEQEFEEYSLTLDWKLVKDDNGGVFVGFPNPGNDPWVAVDQGYEIQIDATDADDRTTGAVYTFQGANLEARDEALNPVGSWNSYDIRVQGDNIKIYLNGVLVNDFTSTDPARDLSSGFIGFQNHGGGETVYYRDVQVKDLAVVEVTPAPVTFIDEDGTESDVYTVPAVEGVEYVVDGEVVPAGAHAGAGTVTVKARALDGYALTEGATAEWTHTFSDEGGEPELVEVTPSAVVFADGPGAENDTMMIPSVVGVEYLVNGEVTVAGTHTASGTVTVVARALDGYVLAEGAPSEWVLTFTTDGGTPPAPDRRTAEFHLSDTWRGSTDTYFMYGRWADEVLIGDWDGDGEDTIAVRRGNQFHVSNAQQGGDADVVLTYGRPGDVILVGDWDGDGTDTFAVRRGNTYHVKNSLRGGDADAVFCYGRENDAVMVGDWDGNGTDTFAVRRAATYHVKNSLRGGDADTVFTYGRAADVTLAGDWDGDGRDTFTVRRGATYHVSNALRGGAPDTVVTFGRAGDEVHVGDWDGNGTDTLGVRRPVGPAPVVKEVRSAAKLG